MARRASRWQPSDFRPSAQPIQAASLWRFIGHYKMSASGQEQTFRTFIGNVRFWLLADILPHPEICPLCPRKRTFFELSASAARKQTAAPVLRGPPLISRDCRGYFILNCWLGPL